MKSLEKNRDFVSSHKEELLNLYPQKYILVVDQHVVNSFDEYETAANFAIENYGLEGDFYIELLTTEEPINFVYSALL